MAASQPRLSPEQRKALELLASDPQGATDELLVLVHGFDGNMISDLVESGLAMARLENMKAGSRAIEVVRIRARVVGRSKDESTADEDTTDIPRADPGHAAPRSSWRWHRITF